MLTVPSVPENVKKAWETWNLRGLVIVSLCLQIFLILFSSSRKRRGGWIVIFIWSAYLFADWVAAVTIGLISNGQGKTNCCYDHPTPQSSSDMLALWAAFLLVHLGGPDTITSSALEDNELWVRHLLGLMLQVFSTIYVFLQSLSGENKLWIPTVFVFVAGVIKYTERTCALYLASIDRFGDSACRKPNAGPEYQRIQKMYGSIRRANLPSQTLTIRGGEPFENMDYLEDQEEADLDPKTTLRFAFELFDTFKGLVVGLFISPQDRHVSREVFLSKSSNDVLHIIEIELSLLYEVLHTKALVVRSMVGLMFRLVNFCCILGAWLSFSFLNKHGHFHKFDIRLSYGLLIGAMALDVVSFMFMIFSDWTVVARENWGSFLQVPASWVIKRRRWSGSISQFNFMTYCLNDYPHWINKLAESLRFGRFLVAMQRFSYETLQKDREWCFIFDELRKKSREAKTVQIGKTICLHRGGGILSRQEDDERDLRWSIDEFEYTESLLLWHIATELCFQDRDQEPNYPDHADSKKNKEICKLISDYLFYILMRKPNMVSAISGNWKLIFRDTRAETKRFLQKSSARNHIEDACRDIREVEAEIKPRALKGGISKSVLFDARILAGQLKKHHQGGGYPWKLMSQVWVELLCHAAINCRPYVHAQQPSNGGELLTFVWLLMNHLGLGTQFSEAEAVRLKFVVRK